MIRSLNEIETVAQRAAAGRGWAFGLADALGEAAVALARAGVDPAPPMAAALRAAPAIAQAGRAEDGWAFAPAPLVAVAPSALELLVVEPSARIILSSADAPMMLIGYALAAARRRGAGVEIVADQASIAVPGAPTQDWETSCETYWATAWESWRNWAAGAASGPVSLRASPQPVSSQALAEARAPEVDPASWDALIALAARRLAAPSDASRSAGAGAGLTDND